MGYTNNKYLNALIVAKNIYYDVYNNGGCNIKDCYMKYIDKYLDDILVINKSKIRNKEYLENYMDRFIEIIIDKDLSYEKFIVYCDHDKKLVSKPIVSYQII